MIFTNAYCLTFQESLNQLVPSHKLSKPLPQSKKENQPPSLPQNVSAANNTSKFHFKNMRTGSEGSSTDRVMNLYGNSSGDNQQSMAKSSSKHNVNGLTGRPSQFSSNLSSVKHSNTNIEGNNFRENHQPLFSTGGKDILI